MGIVMEKFVISGQKNNKNSDMQAGVVIMIALVLNGISSYLLAGSVIFSITTIICTLIMMSAAHQFIRQ